MVDDLTADAVKRMRTEGFGPTLVVETSPGNFQAWLDHGQVLPQRVSTVAARTLAAKFGGDKGAADWRHFGRLAGFTNRKDKYRSQDGAYPFVRIIDAGPSHVYAAAGEFVANVREVVSSLESPTRAAASARNDWRLLSIDDFRSNPSYDGDGNRIDLAYSVYALAHGVSEASIAEAINSRDLSKKGAPSRQSAYTSRTIAKAAQRIHGLNGR
jgi:hypothetical protein